jgi:WD40 repeat protein
MPDAPAAEPLLSLVKIRDRYVTLMQAYAQSGGEPSPELLAEIADFQTQVCAAGAAISGSDERFEAQSTINYWQTVRINAGERPPTQVLVDFDSEAARRQAGNTPPYKGLAPFLTSDHRFFSGRYELVRRLVDKVKFHRLLALTGLSGSGKSSVVRAGLIPDLAAGAYDGIDDNGLTDSATWRFPQPILPGADPLAALEAVYGPIAAAADLPAALDRQGAPVLLSIDQFEEVFTLSPEGDRRTLFLDALVAAASHDTHREGTHRHVVVVTMRSEFDTLVEKHPAFAALFTAGREVIQTMQAADLRKVIEEPANRLGVGFEPGLVDELMTRVQGEPAGLPLLSFTLLKLWERRADGPMKTADYQALGGNPRDILANSADKVFEAFLKQDQDLARGIFTRLVKIGDSLEATSMRITRADLDVLGARDNVNRVLDILVDEGLLRTSPAPPERAATDKAPGQDPDSGWWITPATQIEVAHEALIRNWSRLTEWVKDSFAEQTNRKAFALRAEKWKEGGGDLLSGMSLDEAKEFPDKSPVEAEYIAASVRHSVWRQRKFWGVTAVIAVLAIAASVLSVALIRINRAEREANRADTLFATAEGLVERGELPLAKTLLLEAVPADAELPAREHALLQAILLNVPAETVLEVAGKAVPRGASIANDGSLLMSLWDDGKARIWHRADDRQRGWLPIPVELAIAGRSIEAIALAPDGKTAMSVSSEPVPNDAAQPGAMYLDAWTLDRAGPALSARGTSRPFKPGSGDTITSIKYRNDGQKIVLASRNGQAIVIDVQTGKTDFETPAAGFAALTSAVLSPKGDLVLTAAEDGWIELYNIATGKALLSFLDSEDAATSARFTGSAARFAIGSDDGIIRVYQTNDGEKLYELSGHQAGVTDIAFSPDTSTIVSSSRDGTLRFWDHGINTGRLLRTVSIDKPTADMNAPIVEVTSVAYANDGETVIATASDGKLRVFDKNGRKLISQAALLPADKGGKAEVLAVARNQKTIIATRQRPGSRASKGADDFYLINIANRAAVRELTLGSDTKGDIFDTQVSDDGSQVLVSILNPKKGYDVAIRSAAPGSEPVFLRRRLADLPSVTAMSPDGSNIAIVDAAGQLELWRGGPQATKRYAIALGGTDETGLFGTHQIAFSPAGPPRFAFINPRLNGISIHDLATGKQVSLIETNMVSLLRFTPDGKRLIVGSEFGSVAVHDAATGKLVFETDDWHDSAVLSADVSADGTLLLTTSRDGTARLWDAGTGALIHILHGHQAKVFDARFSPDGRRILTSGDDRTVMVWDSESGKRLTSLRGPARSGGIRGWFGADGNSVTTLSDDTSLRVWNLATPRDRYADLRADVCTAGGFVSIAEQRRHKLDFEIATACAADPPPP